MKLTATQCRNAQPREKVYKLTDGQGLYLEVMPSGAKYWQFQYRYNNKRPRICFGVYPEISLLDAREERHKARETLRQGLDPAIERKRAKQNRAIEIANTFELVAREWHTNNLATWSPGHAKDILLRFERDVFPMIGNVPLTDLKAPDILVVIRKIEARGALELASRALQNIGRVFRYAIATGRGETDPSYRLSEALLPQKTTHYAAFDHKELPSFVFALRSNRARLHLHTQYATDLMMLTFVRTSELIKATWDEFDLEAAEWHIPAARMKMERDHIVPLAKQVVAKLRYLQGLSAGRPYVLPHYSRSDRHISNNTILKALERMGYKGRMTGHGFRALAMSTIKEKLGYRHEVVDRQLAHVPANKVDRAYDRAEFLDERRVMMQDYADYIDECAMKGMQDAL